MVLGELSLIFSSCEKDIMDRVFITSKVINLLNTNSKEGNVATKVDIHKAFDNLN